MDKIYFTVNGEHYSLSGSEVSPDTSLNDYLRNYLKLFGTKAMCHEGGCGACAVAVSRTHPVTKETQVFSVNSCLVHILSCHQWAITTVEGLRGDGYHTLQQRLAAFNGSQCGYCSPGWIMAMYSLQEGAKGKLTTAEIERSFGGHMCRCTGYRPILDAFKTFATDADPNCMAGIQDVEDLHKPCPHSCQRRCSEEWCFVEPRPGEPLRLRLGAGRWYKAYTIEDVFKILTREGSDNYALVAGNTGKGVYWEGAARVQIDIASVEALRGCVRDENLALGAGLSLTEMMEQCKKWAAANEEFKYLDQFHSHLDLVAHVSVRNLGTIGGNLAMKNKHPQFPSDIFLLLQTVQATVTVVNSSLEKQELSTRDFLKADLKNRLITNVKLPPLSASNLVRTYKIMPRAQNAHAIVNAGFLFKMDSANKVVSSNIAFGNISASFVRASETENVIKGQELYSEAVLQSALAKLQEELVPAEFEPEPSPGCRKTLALGLFYKAILSLCPEVHPRYKSGGSILERGVSRGIQTFDTDKALWPLNQPVAKLEALSQCAGEARFVCDIESSPRELHCALVLSKACVAEIDHIDASDALKEPGVVAFFSAKDIPGKNSFTPSTIPWNEYDEEILASKAVSYYGQPVGVIAAVTKRLALAAADMVKVTYKPTEHKPVLTIKDALAAPDKDRRVRKDVTITATDKGEDIQHVIQGTYNVGSQYHYYMETQSCVVDCTEQGLRVRSATQWMDHAQLAVAGAMGLPQNRVQVEVPRVGGGYGGKASRASLTACACALVAYKLRRPATLVLPITDNMHALGKREACEAQYEAGVNASGEIQYLNITYYSDCGHAFSDAATAGIGSAMATLYRAQRWDLAGYSVLTDTASNTWCRAPSTTEATALIEHILEHIAFVTKKDPIDVRLSNVDPKHDTIKDLATTFKKDINFEERKRDIQKFNSDNAWKKKGLKMSLMSYPVEYSGPFPVTISVFHADGTVAIAHGGVEMGQGINTKVAQVCAYKLKIPLEKIIVRGSDTFVSPNAIASSGSITSECVAHATLRACDELLARLGEVRKDGDTWEETVKRAFDNSINLQVSHMMSDRDSLRGYCVYGACAVEVELDVLTGQHVVRRADILEDTGVSLSPNIDVGQIEGAFIMGLGLWTSEQLKYDAVSGALLTDRTWTYKPPGARDIPQDMRVAFRRNSANTAGVLRSKATGEPALVLAVCVTFALRDAVASARAEFHYSDADWLRIENPFTVENILKAISPKPEYYKLK